MTVLTLQPDGTAGIDTFLDMFAVDADKGTAATFQIRNFSSARGIGLLKFSDELLSPLAGATIHSATLYLYGTGGGANNDPYTIRRILPANSTWGETSTHNYRVPSTERWAGDAAGDGGADAGCSVAGTDYSSTEMGSMTFLAAADSENSAALNVAEFLLMLANNHGLLIRSTAGSATASLPGTSDNATAARRPKLVVVYTLPGTLGVGGGGVGGLLPV